MEEMGRCVGRQGEKGRYSNGRNGGSSKAEGGGGVYLNHGPEPTAAPAGSACPFPLFPGPVAVSEEFAARGV